MVGGRGANRINMKTDVTLFITRCLQPVKQNAQTQKNEFLYFLIGALLLSCQDVICPFQPTSWYQGSTARLCKMKAQDWCGLKT